MTIFELLKKIKNQIIDFYAEHFYNYQKSINIYYDFYSDDELIDKIINEKKSITRYGDGEFLLIFGKKIGFQEKSQKLSKELSEVLNNKNSQLIICIPRAINDISNYTDKTKKFYKSFYFRYRKKIEKIINKQYKYGDSLITRFYLDYKDKSNSKARINNIKKIWDDKKILIVEGYNSKLGVGNDLFDNSKSIRRIIVPNTNAFSKKNEIISEVKKNIKKEEIVILAVGPTATVLSSDLTNIGIQCIDLGHIDIEYEWYLSGAQEKISIEGKNVNESNSNINDHELNTSLDEKYKEEIIKKI